MREAERLVALRLNVGQVTVKTDKQARSFLKYVPGSLGERLSQAGIRLSPLVYRAMVLVISLAVYGLFSLVGTVLGVFAGGSFGFYALTWYIEERAEKRRQKVIPQLPAFIDALASALSTGFNVEAAVMQATNAIPEGVLRFELDKVVDALKRGFSLEDSVLILKRCISGREITSLSVAIQLFSSMGGRLLEPFRRLAKKMRDQQQIVERAGRDLVQIRQAFRIIFALSLLAPGAVSLMQPEYIVKAFHDSTANLVLQIAVIMQITAILFFKRITNVRV